MPTGPRGGDGQGREWLDRGDAGRQKDAGALGNVLVVCVCPLFLYIYFFIFFVPPREHKVWIA